MPPPGSGYAGDLLVGNFGNASGTSPNGTIDAINLTTLNPPVTVTGSNGTGVSGDFVNPGLWGLLPRQWRFGRATNATLPDCRDRRPDPGPARRRSRRPHRPGFTVAAAPLTAMGVTIRGIEGLPLTTSSTGVLVATFMDTGTPGAASSYTATINWGDGSTTTTGTITSQGTPDGEVYSVFGDHTYAGDGTYPVTVTITNTANGAVAIASSQAVIAPLLIADAPPTVTTPERTIFSGPVGEFTDPNPTGTASEFEALIFWGDGSPASAGTVSLVRPRRPAPPS